jgi:tetratricopeptide (TPR) repeat protein
MKNKTALARGHINAKKTETTALSLVIIIISILFIVSNLRDRFVAPVLAYTESDALVKIIYFDKLSDPQLHFSLGNYYFGEGAHYDLYKAESYYQKALFLDEKLPLANYQLSRVYFVGGDQKKALAYINKELEYHPDFKRSHYIRGLVYGYSGQLNLAVEDFKSFLAWKPNSWAGHNDLAWIYFQQGDFENAYLTASEGLAFSPGNPWLLNSVGISLKNLGRPELAGAAFQAALIGVGNISAEDWGKAYPGNDPDFYQKGYGNMLTTIEKNIKLLDAKQ